MVTNATIPLIGKGQNMDHNRQGAYNNQQIIDRIINQQNMQAQQPPIHNSNKKRSSKAPPNNGS